MVGNIRDIKILTDTREISPDIPGSSIAPELANTPPMAKNIIRRAPLMYFINQVQIHLPVRNEIMAAILYQVAVNCSSGGREAFILSTYWNMKVQHIICAPT